MNKTKNVLIASVFICLLLIFVFLIYLSFISRSVIYTDDTATILITQKADDLEELIIDSASSTKTPNPPGVYSIGMHVVISGTGGDGLRMREAAGLGQTPLYLGSEGEQFIVIGGPQIIDNNIWWKIQSSDNSSKVGWAVQDYLTQN